MARQYSFPSNHWDWPVKLTHHHAVRAGDLIFTGGQVDLDPQGTVRNIGDLTTQCRNSMVYMETLFQDLGVGFDDLVRLVVYFVGDATDEARLLDLLADIIGPRARPTITMIPMPELCYPDMLTEIEGVAMRATDGTKIPKQCFQLPNLPALPQAFSHVVRAGDMVFTSDLSARNAQGEVDHPGDLTAQTRITMERLQQALAEAGADLGDVVKLSTFASADNTPCQDEAAALRATYFAAPGPSVTELPLARSPHPDLVTKISATAMHGAGAKHTATPDGHWTWSAPRPYSQGNRVGTVLHIGGQMALDTDAIARHPGDMVAQTRIAMESIARILAEFDATLDDVVKVTTFYQGSASAEALHENLLIRSNSYTAPGPATTGIPVPALTTQGIVIAIEVIAVLDRIQT